MSLTTAQADSTAAILAAASNALDKTRAKMAAAREALAKRIAAGDDSNRLISALEIIAKHEGAEEAFSLITRYATSLPLAAIAAEAMMKGADDGWSGRGNDMRRAKFDGLRDAFRSMTYLS